VTGSIGALLLLGITSSIEASKPALAVYFHAITVYLAVFGLWLAYFVNSEARARLVFLAYLTGGLVCAGLGIAALITPIGALDQFAHFGLRAKGPFADQNVFGPFMIPLALILFEELLDPRMLRMRTPLKLAMLLVLSAAILLSFSRGAWMNAVIGLGVVLVVLALRRGGISRPGTLIVIVATTITAGLLAISLSGTGGYLSERGGAQKYDVNRFAAQEAGLEMAESHPLGIGPGQFEDTVGIGAHNTYIRVAAEQGPLGFIALLVLFGGTLALALGNTALGRHTYGIGSAALLGAWCGLLASSLFVDTLHWRHLWLVAALIWAGAMRGSVSRAPHGALAPRTRPRTTRDDR
jgi:O-antigen ligase